MVLLMKQNETLPPAVPSSTVRLWVLLWSTVN